MATQADLVSDVLEELYVLEAGQTPSATDAATVNKAILRAHAVLQEKRIAYWELSAIPDAVMDGLTLVVAGHCARKFIPEMTLAECKQMRELGTRELREVIAMQQDHQPVPQNYF